MMVTLQVLRNLRCKDQNEHIRLAPMPLLILGSFSHVRESQKEEERRGGGGGEGGGEERRRCRFPLLKTQPVVVTCALLELHVTLCN